MTKLVRNKVSNNTFYVKLHIEDVLGIPTPLWVSSDNMIHNSDDLIFIEKI